MTIYQGVPGSGARRRRPLNGDPLGRCEGIMELRAATIADARSIAAVHIASWRAIYEGHMPDDVLKGLDLEQRATGWHERLALPSIDCIVAEAPPVIGFCNVCASRDPDCEAATGEITALYLDPQHWRRGVGRPATGHPRDFP